MIKFIRNYKNIGIISLVLLSIVCVIFLYLNINNKPILQIIIDQEDFLITVQGENNSYTSKSDFNKKVDKGIYTIKVEKNNYITEQRQINVQVDTKIEIKLFQSSFSDLQKSYKQEPYIQISMMENKNNQIIYGINRENGNLIQFEGEKQKTIYNGKVKDYSIGNNFIIVLDSSNLNQILIIDISTLKIKRIEKKDLYPITSVSLSEDEKTIFFLAEFNLKNKISTLYSTDFNGNLLKISETSAQSIEYLKNDQIILFEENHELDKNRVIFFDTAKEDIILSRYANKYSISPDKSHILIHKSTNIEIINTSDYSIKSRKILESSRSAWKDANTLYLFRNHEENIYFLKVTIEPFEVEDFNLLISGLSLQEVFGFLGNIIYLQDYKNKIFSLKI